MIAQISRIQSLFVTRAGDEKVMFLFISTGYPDLESTVDLILRFEKKGTDLGYPRTNQLSAFV